MNGASTSMYSVLLSPALGLLVAGSAVGSRPSARPTIWRWNKLLLTNHICHHPGAESGGTHAPVQEGAPVHARNGGNCFDENLLGQGTRFGTPVSLERALDSEAIAFLTNLFGA
jgi:hypothetical protein